MLCHGIALPPWLMPKSEAMLPSGFCLCGIWPAPVAFGLGFDLFFIKNCAIVVFFSPLRRQLVQQDSFLCFGGPPQGLHLSLVSFLYLSFLTCLEEGIAPSCFRLRCYEGGGGALG